MWPEQDLAWGQGGPVLGPDGPFPAICLCRGCQGAPRLQPAPHSHPAILVLQRTFGEHPCRADLVRHGRGWRPLPQADSARTVAVSRTDGSGQKLCWPRACTWGRARGVLRPSMPWVRPLPLSLPLQPWAGVPPSLLQPLEWSPGWRLHLQSLHPSLSLPGLFPVVNAREDEGKRREPGWLHRGRSSGKEGEGIGPRGALVLEPTGGGRLGVAGLPQIWGCRRGEDVPGPGRESGCPSQAPPGSGRPGWRGEPHLLCFPFATTEEGRRLGSR